MGLLDYMVDKALKKAQEEVDKRSAKSEQDAADQESGSKEHVGPIQSSQRDAKPRPKRSPNT